MLIEKKLLKDLKPAPYNPRQSTAKQEAQLKRSLEKFGVVEPIIWNKQTGYIVGGHFRVRELHKLGYKEIDCVIVDLNEEDEKELNIRLNANTGEFDWDVLANEWDADKLEDWGLDLPVFDQKSLEAEEDDYEIHDEIKTDIVLGDLFEIGEHRLLCGDSTDSDQVAKLMNGEKADMAHNDPPYGMKKEKDGVLNDNLNFDNLLEFNKDWISLQFTYLKDNGSFYCWGIDEPLMDIYSNILKPYIKTQKATFRNLITWDKGNGQGQNSEEFRMYPIADEKCLFVMLGVQGFNNNADNYFEGWEGIRTWLINEYKKMNMTRKQVNDLLGSSPKSAGGLVSHYFDFAQWSFIPEHQYKKLQSYCEQNNIDAFKRPYTSLNKEKKGLKEEFESTRAYFDNTHDNQNNVWHFDRTSKQEREGTGKHATPKPIALCERAIKSSCPENGLVIDFFLGSGSTMVAAHQLKRKCYGMELEPKYCQVIIDRMKKLDPTLIIKKNGETVK